MLLFFSKQNLNRDENKTINTYTVIDEIMSFCLGSIRLLARANRQCFKLQSRLVYISTKNNYHISFKHCTMMSNSHQLTSFDRNTTEQKFPTMASPNGRKKTTQHLENKSFSTHEVSIKSQDVDQKRSSSIPSEKIVWVDLEMTGLDVEKDKIIEIACLVTDGDLNLLAEGLNIVIHQSDSLLNNMDEWCVQQHGQSGLTEAVKKSHITTDRAEQMVLDFLKLHTEKGQCPLGGSSVGIDKQFIAKYMPKLAEHFHYRIIDVSSIKELCRRWYPGILEKAPDKKLSHRALDDIMESVEELKFYRSTIFK
ncbi:unnamed protein product [Lymnaea stagnalis]|uniref:Exonuclease domain-containing protein n=1 Tax=Lymnaea stagnalis TaxID=6523 RepID=A0AAV2H7A1_LYMST